MKKRINKFVHKNWFHIAMILFLCFVLSSCVALQYRVKGIGVGCEWYRSAGCPADIVEWKK